MVPHAKSLNPFAGSVQVRGVARPIPVLPTGRCSVLPLLSLSSLCEETDIMQNRNEFTVHTHALNIWEAFL